MGILVETNIPYGNACNVSASETVDGAVVRLAADPHGGPECLWFCVRLRQTEPARVRSVRLVIESFTNMLGAGDPAYVRPVVRRAGGDWERLGPGERIVLPDGRIEAAWTVELGGELVDAALCYPYGMPEIADLLRDTRGYWRADTIGVSQGGRPLVRLSNGTGEGARRPGLYLVARQHSGETPGSWALDGFLRQLAEAPGPTPLVWAVPLSNTDGVEQGDYGKDNFPYDLNRAWGSPPMRHEVLAIQRDMHRWQARCRPCLGIDFHAPGACEHEGVYGYVPDRERFPSCHTAAVRWGRVLGEALTREYAAAVFTRGANYASRWETPHFDGWCAALRIPAISLETPYAMIGERVLLRSDYQEIGRRLAKAVLQELRFCTH